MIRYYPQEFYWAWEGSQKALDWEDMLERRRAQLEAKAKWLAHLTPGRLLDIGAQKGEFLWHMRSKGWDVEGIELEPSVPNPARMPIRYGDFLDVELKEGDYDAVTFWAVLEHLYRPVPYMERAVQCLRPGGTLVAVVTNLRSIQSRYFRADDFPRHLTVFTAKALKRLCADNGLEVTRMVTDQNIFGGALNGGFVYAAKRLSGYSENEAFREWKQQEDPLRYWVQFRGKNSPMIKAISRLDRLITYPIENVLDRLGFGFNIVFSAKKPG